MTESPPCRWTKTTFWFSLMLPQFADTTVQCLVLRDHFMRFVAVSFTQRYKGV